MNLLLLVTGGTGNLGSHICERHLNKHTIFYFATGFSLLTITAALPDMLLGVPSLKKIRRNKKRSIAGNESIINYKAPRTMPFLKMRSLFKNVVHLSILKKLKTS